MSHSRLVVFGLGYSGTAIARAASAAGMEVTATSRDPGGAKPPPGVCVVPFDHAGAVVAEATHLVATAPPGGAGDPVLCVHADAILNARHLRWAGYLSTTGVYGDRGGGWVDETTLAAPSSDRARRRVAAEQAWTALAERMAVDIFRVAGIYGPGRSAFDDLRSGRARRVLKPGHAFGRIHRDDIAGAVMAAASQTLSPGLRVLHLADDVPAESAEVIAEAAGLMGVPLPPAIAFAEARLAMSEMAASFWAENRKVASAMTQEMLGYRWQYPSYREGLRAILAEERRADPVTPDP
jgi:nucleoside-diphosphate-sugar epimerase